MDIRPISSESAQYLAMNSKIKNHISLNDEKFSLPDILIDEIPMDESKIPAAIRLKSGLGFIADAEISRMTDSIVMNIKFAGNEIKITIEAKGKDLVFVNIAKNKKNPICFTGKLTMSEDDKNITINDLQSDKNITIQVNGKSEIEITNNFLESRATLVLKPRQKIK